MVRSFFQTPKGIAILMMAAVSVMISAIDLYLPALPQLRDYFQTTEYKMQLSIIASPFASALVGMIFGRMSDVHGRRPLFLISLTFFLIGSIGCCFCCDINTFLASRFIQAIGGGGISVLAVVVLSDLFHGIQYARYMGIYGALFPMIFAIAPVVGAQILCFCGWRWTFALVVVCTTFILISVGLYLPETFKISKTSSSNENKFLAKVKTVLRNPEFVLLGLGHALPISIVGLFTANGSFIFIDSYGFSPSAYSIIQSIPIGVNFISAFAYRSLLPRLGLNNAIKVGMFGYILFAILIIGVILKVVPCTPIFIIAALCLPNFSMPYIVASCATRAFESVPEDKGLAVSLVALARNASLAVSVLLMGLFIDGTMVPIFSGMLVATFLILSVLIRPVFKQNSGLTPVKA